MLTFIFMTCYNSIKDQLELKKIKRVIIMPNDTPKDDQVENCSIGLIAAPREKSVISQLKHYFGSFISDKFRGDIVFSGHTAVLLKQNDDVKIASGFIPKSDWEFMATSYSDYLQNKPSSPVEAKWVEREEALLRDNKRKTFEIPVSKEIAKEFENYFNAKKNDVTHYSIQPGSETGKIALHWSKDKDSIDPSQIKGNAVVLVGTGRPTSPQNPNHPTFEYEAYFVENNKLVKKNDQLMTQVTKLSKEEQEMFEKEVKKVSWKDTVSAMLYGYTEQVNTMEIKRSVENSMLISQVINNAIPEQGKALPHWERDPFMPHNCVYSAINVVLDFFYTNQDKFPKEKWENEIEPTLNMMIEATSNRPHCGQGSLMFNVAAWNQPKENIEAIHKYLNVIKNELHQKGNKDDVELIDKLLKINKPKDLGALIECTKVLTDHLIKEKVVANPEQLNNQWNTLLEKNKIEVKLSDHIDYDGLKSGVGLKIISAGNALKERLKTQKGEDEPELSNSKKLGM